MSNLGSYQVITTTAKKFGGPWGLLGTVAALGYGVGKLIEVSGEAITEHIQKKRELDHIKWMLEQKTFGEVISSGLVQEDSGERIACSIEDVSILQNSEFDNLDD